MFQNSTNVNRTKRSSGTFRKSVTFWMALLGLVAVVMPFGSGCDEEQAREMLAEARDAAEDLDPWTKFCLLNTDAEDFAACEAGHVE